MLTGADILIDCLHRHGMRHVFGMPGSHSTAIYDAFARHGQIRTILARNEQAGAFMADGYARVTGRPGVICTTAGPGATNALTGIAEAWGDSIPVLLLAGQVNHDCLNQECGNYHEIDLESIFRPCSKYVATVTDTSQIPGAVMKAFAAMTSGRHRPAALLLPQDLMAAATPHVPVETFAVDSPKPDLCPAETVQRAADLLARAKRPMVLAGGGALWSGAGELLHTLAGKLRCPIVTTLNAKGIIDERDPFSLGHPRSIRGRVAFGQTDTLLTVGCRFTEVFTDFRRMRVPKTLVQIDIEPGQIGVNYPAEVGLVGDARDMIQRLLEALPEKIDSNWREVWEQARAAVHPNPEWLIEALRAELPDHVPVFTDACEMAYRMHMDYPAHQPRTFFYPSNFIALGWGFPAAVGAAVALPDRPVVSVSGDGGFTMTMQELATAARYRLHLIAIVHNDNAYGAIRHGQRKRYAGRFLDTDLNNPDFLKLAAAFDIPGARTPDRDSFRAALRQALERPGPSLIEVPDQWRYFRLKQS